MTNARLKLLELVVAESITDEEAGEPEWASYLNDRQLAHAICSLRPKSAAAREMLASLPARSAADVE